MGGINAIPELAPQWKDLDLAEILTRPAAYMSVSQNKSLYDPGGVQAGEKHRERGSLPATVKVVTAARKAPNFKSFNWIGYEVFRENYPQSDFDRVQYASWVKGLNFTPEMKKKDGELVGELRALVHPGDNEFNELALQTAFAGTQLPLELARKRIPISIGASRAMQGRRAMRAICLLSSATPAPARSRNRRQPPWSASTTSLRR